MRSRYFDVTWGQTADDSGHRRRYRRHRLADELPESGFPAGVGAPSTALLVLLMLLVGFCVIQFRDAEPAVPAAVVQSQQKFTEGLARSVGSTAKQAVIDLRVIAALAPADLSGLPSALLGSHPKWRGMVVLDSSTRKLVAASGEPIPLNLVPREITGAAVTAVRQADKSLRMLVILPMPDRPQRLLVASSVTGIPNVPLDFDQRQGLLLTTRRGEVIDSRGTVPAADDRSAAPLVERAVAASAAGRSGIVIGDPMPDADPGNASGRTTATVVGHAPVTVDDLSGTLGLSVISVTQPPVVGAASVQPGLLPAAALAFVALLGFGLIRWTLVHPVRRLRAGAIAVAQGQLAQPVHRTRSAEVWRIRTAVESCRAQLRRERPGARRPRLRWPAAIGVVLASLLLLGWSVAVAVNVGGGEARVPGSVVTSSRGQVGITVDAIRRSLNDGFADLNAVAKLGAGREPAALRSTVKSLAEHQARYRSVYLTDASGRATITAGRPPLRNSEPLDRQGKLLLQDSSSRVPVLFAYAPLPDGVHTLVAEFDIEYLAELLNRAPGRVRIVDSQLRTIVSTRGYVAFEPLPEGPLRTGVTDALAGNPTAGVRGTDGDRMVLAARAVDGNGAAAALRWAVVSVQPVDELSLPANTVRRAGQVAALIGVILAFLFFGWHYLVLVRPLRRLASAADQLAGGNVKSVIYPQRHDQIGTIAACLEICRQALIDGAGRLGVARRPRGAATDVTLVMDVDRLRPIFSRRARADVGTAAANGRARHRATRIPTETSRAPRPSRDSKQWVEV